MAASSPTPPGTTQPTSAVTVATVAIAAAMTATKTAATITTTTAGKQCVPDGASASIPTTTIPTAAGNIPATATAATKWVPATVEYGSMTGGATDKIGCNLITNSKFETYLSNSTHNNQYAMLANMDNDEITIVANNRSTGKQLAYNAASLIQISKDLGIADAGATGHFLQPGAPAINMKRTPN